MKQTKQRQRGSRSSHCSPALERECGHCGGTGRIKLEGKYRETWNLLAEHGESNPAALAIYAGCTIEAMANRLKVLMDHGFVVRGRSRGDNKRWFYKVSMVWIDKAKTD